MQTIYLDISNKGVIPTIYAKQGDVGRKFRIVFTNAGLPYNLENCLFSAWYQGDSGEGNYTQIGEDSAFVVDGNCVEVELITQMLSVPGCGELSLVLSDENTQIGSWNIPYICEEKPGANSEKAEAYYTAFTEVIESAKKFTIDKTLTKSGFPADAAETGRQISVERARIDQFVSLPNGSTVADAELMDIRIGVNGETWNQAGNAVRIGNGQSIALSNLMLQNYDLVYEDILSTAEKVEGKFWRPTTQTEGSSTSWDYYILPVSAGDLISIHHTLSVNTPIQLFFDDAVAATYPRGKQDLMVGNDVLLAIPAGVNKIIFSQQKSGYYGVASAKKITAATPKEKHQADAYTSVLWGKTLVTVGDSITYGADMDAPGIANDGTLKTYGWQIAYRNHMEFHNCGVSGSTVFSRTTRTDGFAEPNGRYTQLPENIDYLTLWFGWNDYAAILAGEGTLGDINSTDINTYYGAYNTVIPYLINKYPNAKIGLIVPFGWSAEIRQAVRDLGNKWGLGVFDNYGKGTPLYFGKESDVGVSQEAINMRQATYQANGAHPSYAGHSALATQIEAWLKTL